MTITIPAEVLLKAERAARREAARGAGYYDGRNAPRRDSDKRKQASKRACRGRVYE